MCTQCFCLYPDTQTVSADGNPQWNGCRSCHPGAQGHQPPLPNKCTSSLHKQITLLVYIHLRLYVSSPKTCALLIPWAETAWVAFSLFYISIQALWKEGIALDPMYWLIPLLSRQAERCQRNGTHANNTQTKTEMSSQLHCWAKYAGNTTL